MFTLSDQPILPQSLTDTVRNSASGGFVSFEGWVRNHNDGMAVEKLAYEAFEALAVHEGNAILQEARERFAIEQCACVHRTGTLEIGELAVWVGVSAAHRDTAFQACRYIIDAIKARLPIWKKEHYVDGRSEWVNCQQCQHHAPLPLSEADYYARQITLEAIGPSGQDRLKAARVLVVGSGGLGVPVLQYLAGAGIGTLGVCDADSISLHNLHRQPMYRAANCGQPKAALAAEYLQALNPFIQVNIHPEAFTPHNARELAGEYDLLLDCTDNFEAKFLLSDVAVETGTPLVQASLYQYEGQLHVYQPQVAGSGCMRCLWPEDLPVDCVDTCSEAGILGAVAGVFGSLQATEALKLLLGLPVPATGELILMNLLTYDVQRLQRPQSPQCRCAQQVNAEGPALTIASTNVGISAHAIPQDATWIDIRDSVQDDSLPPSDWRVCPGAKLLETVSQTYLAETTLVLVCHHGLQSRYWAKMLRRNGYPDAYSLNGGFAALQEATCQPV